MNISQDKKIFGLLLLSSIFSCSLLLFRLYKTGALEDYEGGMIPLFSKRNWMFLFLVWNLFLAWIPFLLSSQLERFWQLSGSKILLGFYLLIWLLFLPNAPYLITDLLHLRPRPPLPLWYDLMMIYAFAWTGLMLGFFSLLQVENFWRKHISSSTATFFAYSVLALCSFGIYIGRFQRWNSWDIIQNPTKLMLDVLQLMANPIENIRFMGIVAVFFCLLSIGYYAFNLRGYAKK